MKRKQIFIVIIFLTFHSLLFSQRFSDINPTGTYKLNPNLDLEADTINDSFGQIQILPLYFDQVVLSFYINRGHPSYNSGDFLDTLNIIHNQIIYFNKRDSNCVITFLFDNEGVLINEKTDYNTGSCGFGYGVRAKGYFKKISTNPPKLIDPLTGILFNIKTPNRRSLNTDLLFPKHVNTAFDSYTQTVIEIYHLNDSVSYCIVDWYNDVCSGTKLFLLKNTEIEAELILAENCDHDESSKHYTYSNFKLIDTHLYQKHTIKVIDSNTTVESLIQWKIFPNGTIIEQTN